MANMKIGNNAEIGNDLTVQRDARISRNLSVVGDITGNTIDFLYEYTRAFIPRLVTNSSVLTVVDTPLIDSGKVKREIWIRVPYGQDWKNGADLALKVNFGSALFKTTNYYTSVSMETSVHMGGNEISIYGKQTSYLYIGGYNRNSGTIIPAPTFIVHCMEIQ